MRVVVAPDKFKGSLTAAQAARAISAGWRRADPTAELIEAPLADGGDGTLETLLEALGGRVERARVTGPSGDPVDAAYGLVDAPDGLLAVVEMSNASGLRLVSGSRRDPMRATTYGTGELILAAATHAPARIMVCIGGSATTDGGAGMAQALGVRLLDAEGRDLAHGGGALGELATIDATGLSPEVRGLDVLVATDVDNPLTGPTGAAAMYGPQKGATPQQVAILDQSLRHLAAVINRDLGIDVRDLAGAGAAGGLGAGLIAFLGARVRPGFEVVAEALDLAGKLEWADVVVTGEGRFDEQTERGKCPAGALRLSREAGCRAVVIAGEVAVRPDAERVYSLIDRAESLQDAIARAAPLLEQAAEEAARATLEAS